MDNPIITTVQGDFCTNTETLLESSGCEGALMVMWVAVDYIGPAIVNLADVVFTNQFNLSTGAIVPAAGTWVFELCCWSIA